jgi:hypothetical protein
MNLARRRAGERNGMVDAPLRQRIGSEAEQLHQVVAG